MDFLSLVCDLIQAFCWIVALMFFIRLFRERDKLRRDNRIMFETLVDIASEEVTGEEVQLRASEVIELMTDEVE